jgi:hypothetical protein
MAESFFANFSFDVSAKDRIRAVNEGIRNPVLTFTKAAAASDQPMIFMGMPAWSPMRPR